jgi:hypothetical protein
MSNQWRTSHVNGAGQEDVAPSRLWLIVSKSSHKGNLITLRGLHLFALRNATADLNAYGSVTRRVHGYETSGVGWERLHFLRPARTNMLEGVNPAGSPCASGHTSDNRWNYDAIDPNRNFTADSTVLNVLMTEAGGRGTGPVSAGYRLCMRQPIAMRASFVLASGCALIDNDWRGLVSAFVAPPLGWNQWRPRIDH